MKKWSYEGIEGHGHGYNIKIIAIHYFSSIQFFAPYKADLPVNASVNLSATVREMTV